MGTWKLAMTDHQIDQKKLHGALRTMSDEQICYMLDKAIEFLSKAKLAVAANVGTPAQRQAPSC